MSETQYAQFREMLQLIAKYDWATEGAPPPQDNTLSRQGAIAIRNGLVQLAKELTDDQE
jgi:hypothetical protein